MIWIFIFACFITAQVQCEGKLLLLEVIFRHGDRAPRFLYPTDPNPELVWPEGLGKLTELGRKQHYGLGQFLRDLYKNFVTSNPNEVTVNSTAVDRCLKSALSNIASFYAPTPEWMFDDNIHWQPITVNYIAKQKDMVLSPESECPEANEERHRVYKSHQCMKLLSDHKEMLKKLSSHSGVDLSTFINAYHLYDTLFVEKKYNLIIPWWAELYWDELSDFAAKALSSCKSYTHVLQRLRAGPFIKTLIEDMEMKISGRLPNIKVRVYSAHEHNIRAILTALKVYNYLRPPYCATILFELHELTPGQNAVRLLYLNSTTPEDVFQEPHVLILDGCFEYCPLDHFIKFTKHLKLNSWEKECGL